MDVQVDLIFVGRTCQVVHLLRACSICNCYRAIIVGIWFILVSCFFSYSRLQSGYLEKHMSRDMIFPTMWYVRPAKPQISLRKRAVSYTHILLRHQGRIQMGGGGGVSTKKKVQRCQSWTPSDKSLKTCII